MGLVVTRKIGEQVKIGDAITVTILDIERRGTVRIGVEAPRDVPVLRGELAIRDRPPTERPGGNDERFP